MKIKTSQLYFQGTVGTTNHIRVICFGQPQTVARQFKLTVPQVEQGVDFGFCKMGLAFGGQAIEWTTSQLMLPKLLAALASYFKAVRWARSNEPLFKVIISGDRSLGRQLQVVKVLKKHQMTWLPVAAE